ncbi:OadG family protein, partial [Allomuricauda sp. CP2A]|uniref:OadG family protein n=2 Tax=unclassified Allomuricauda TaxID=2615049 RepID=UPI001C40081C
MLKEKNELENKDLLIDRSDEVNQILGKPPNWIIKWGITIVFIVLMFLIILINLISYKETINSPVELNISKSISYLRKKTNEKI